MLGSEQNGDLRNERKRIGKTTHLGYQMHWNASCRATFQGRRGISRTAMIIAAVGSLLFIAAMILLVLAFRRKKDDDEEEPDTLYSGALAQASVEPLHTEIAVAAAARTYGLSCARADSSGGRDRSSATRPTACAAATRIP